LIQFIIAGVCPIGGWDCTLTVGILNTFGRSPSPRPPSMALRKEVALETNLARR
jgi:hypothetical protein